MNLQLLEVVLKTLQVPDYVVSVGRLKDDRFCLVPDAPEPGRFSVFWYERGSRNDLGVYDSEEAACYAFLGMIGGELGGRQPVPEGAGMSGSVGGLPVDDPSLRALFAGTSEDVYCGLGETEWLSRFVAPEDVDKPVGARRLVWPDPDQHPQGFATPTGREPAQLPVGTLLDSFGPTFTHVLYDAGAPFEQRSLPPDYAVSGYRRWRVLIELPVWSGPVAPWFGQPGGAAAHFTLRPVLDLVGNGYLEEVAG